MSKTTERLWIGRHKNDVKNDRLLIFQFKEDAEKWRDQYKAGYAWLDELIIKPNEKINSASRAAAKSGD